MQVKRKKPQKNQKNNNMYYNIHNRLAKLYLSGNDVLSLPDDTEIFVNTCRIYTQLANSTAALYAAKKESWPNDRKAKYICSYNYCRKVLDRIEREEQMFVITTAKEVKECFCDIKNLPANTFRRKEKKNDS